MSTSLRDEIVLQQQPSRPGSIAMVTASWSLAGGLAGGLLIVGFIMAGRLHPDGLVIMMMGALGSLFGAVHGAALGHLGRPAAAPDAARWREWGGAVLAAAAGFVVAVSAALWLSMSAVAVRAGNPLGWVTLAVSGAFCLAVFVWATVLGWRALENAYARWPDHWLGSWLVFGVFMVLTGTLLLLRPALPGTGLQLSSLATIVLAAIATLWIALPAIVVALSLGHRR